ncbi:hypothetical protein HRbin30_02727 [bacterium HR30]|nr:hypothetical protein HRbin30_02727 [bacterium HR30]
MMATHVVVEARAHCRAPLQGVGNVREEVDRPLRARASSSAKRTNTCVVVTRPGFPAGLWPARGSMAAALQNAHTPRRTP